MRICFVLILVGILSTNATAQQSHPAIQQLPSEQTPIANDKLLLIFADVAPYRLASGGPPPETVRKLVGIDPAKLGKEFQDFLVKLQPLFQAKPPSGDGFQLEEIQLELTLTAEGKVGIYVGGATVGGSGTIRAVLRRPDKGPEQNAAASNPVVPALKPVIGR